MTDKRIIFGKFEFPILPGLVYLLDDERPESDYLFVNEPRESFSMYFEKDFPIFTVPEKSEIDYCLFELRRTNRVIKFFCPEGRKYLNTAVWYFNVELLDAKGKVHALPGQVRVEFDGNYLRQGKGKPSFIDVLEQVRLSTATSV